MLKSFAVSDYFLYLCTTWMGRLAQLAERLIVVQEVNGSRPLSPPHN